MKKILVFVILFSSLSVYAQERYLGVKGSFRFTDLFAQLLDTDFIARSSFGLTYQTKLNPNMNLAVEVLYSGRGFGEDIKFLDGTNALIGEGEVKVLHDYLSVPLMIGFKLGKKPNLFLNAGLVPAVLLDSYSKKDVSSFDVQFSSVDELKRIDLAGRIELEKTIKTFDKSDLYVSSGFQASFTTLNKVENSRVRSRHFLVQLSLGYRFAI